MASGLLYWGAMSEMIHTIYQLRLLQEKLASVQGLTMEEVVELETLESELENPLLGRAYRRLDLRISAMLRYPGKNALVHVLDLSPGGIRIKGCPDLFTGEVTQLHLRESEQRSYRFSAQVIWIRSHHGECTAGLRFVGQPMLINHGPPSTGPENIAERINVAQG